MNQSPRDGGHIPAEPVHAPEFFHEFSLGEAAHRLAQAQASAPNPVNEEMNNWVAEHGNW